MTTDRDATLLQFAVFMQARDARTEDGPTGVTWEMIGPPGQAAYLQDADMYLSAIEMLGYVPATVGAEPPVEGPAIGMEVIDGRDSLGVVILRAQGDESIVSEIKGLRVDKLTAARLFYQLANQLKALHDAETRTDTNPEGGGQ